MHLCSEEHTVKHIQFNGFLYFSMEPSRIKSQTTQTFQFEKSTNCEMRLGLAFVNDLECAFKPILT